MAIGDLVFMMLVGGAAMAAMHVAHTIGWNFALAMAVGMTGAMLVQFVLALLAAPILGSIETMVPSMPLAMLAPMSICILYRAGCVPSCPRAFVLGAAGGALWFSLLSLYGRSCRRWAASVGSAGQGGTP